jgi:RNA polymerase sigma factor (sigma-70 family)
MSHSALAAGLRHLRGKLASQRDNEDSDEQLLHSFAACRDDSAFAVLVRRHGPMVLHVCRRVLGHEQDTEDVFQATFLVLARRAATLRKKASLASFLHGTAYRLALSAKRSAARRHKHEGRAAAPLAVHPADDLSWREVQALLDEEIAHLPEKYRSALILCCLEDRSRAEAARRLGVNENTLSSRLAEARRRLRQRLARRGVELTAVLTTSALTAPAASALSPILVSSTLKAALATALNQQGTAGLVSAPVAGLVKRAASPALPSKIGIFLALAAGALAVAAASRAALRREPPAPMETAPRIEATAKAPAEKPAAAVVVRGRILDPDGKPIQGVRLYWPRLPKTEPRTEEEIENIPMPQRGKTNGEGRFRFELPRSDINPDWNLALVAAADGYGLAWADWPALEKGGELTLRLVKDQPIEGRIISLEGKPLASVRVSIGELGAMTDGKVETFLTAWKREWQQALNQTTQRMYGPMFAIPSLAATTDKDGRFRITGAGAERLVVLWIQGSGIAQAQLYVINRAGFDAAPVNKAVFDRIPAELRQPGQPPLLYGPKLTYVVPASRRIEGTVREAGSGKPVAGYVIGINVGYGFGIDAVSDKEGHYRLDGVPKVKQYLLTAEPPEGSSWLRAGARPDDTEGVQPLTVDFTVARGIVLSGRILDKTTGKGVEGGIRFVPLPDNTFADKPGFDSYKYERLTTPVDEDGRFKLTVVPGPGVLMAQASGNNKVNGQAVNPYKHAEFDAKDRAYVQATETDDGQRFTTHGNSIESLDIVHAAKVLDLAPDAGMATCDLFVQRAQTLTVQIEDADAKPLKGAIVAGLTDGWSSILSIKDASCPVFALDGKKPRRLLFYHVQRSLAGSLTVRGDEKEPPIARLIPTGAVTGRVLDREGQPIAGAEVNLSSPDNDASELYQQLDQRRKMIHTDKDGRFRIEGIVPDVKFQLRIYQGRTFLVGEPRIGARQVKSGATLDLGDVRVKPGP